MLFVVVFLGVVDMNLYSYWGFKLDITPLLYLKTPGDALASVSILEIAFLVLIFAVLFALLLFTYLKYIKIPAREIKKSEWKTGLISLIFTCFLILPARGGIGLATLNLGAVYFHAERFANHSAINVFWNTIYSISEKERLNSSFEFMASEKANMLFKKLHVNNEGNTRKIVKEKANIILIILESFSNKVIEPLGGEKDITPEFNKLCSEGLLFTNFFATGDRSDKGLVGLFSGFPSQPLTSIINYPSKTQALPFIKDPFYHHGYTTAFYHGGNLDFANFRSYFTRESISKIIDINHFPRSYVKQKWGVPDNYVYERILKDLDNIKQPFFISFFTLSSHEPFDVPGEPVFGSSGRDDLSRNAFHFSDLCLGNFIREAKQKSWWNNTLIILLADHGSRSPGNTPNHERLKFSIPMLWIGGALLCQPGVNPVYGSQVDLPATLSGQFGFDYSNYKYSKNLLSPRTEGYAYYSFNNGFGFFNNNIELIYDNSAGRYVHINGSDTEKWQDYGKAILQLTTNDFLKP